MQADLSRSTFQREKHYIQVLNQQGRVQVDADWNEQQAIYQHRIETEARDIIGPAGAPLDNAGFEITITNNPQPPLNVLNIGAGRYYVDGILCENEAKLVYGDQPALQNTAAQAQDILQLFQQQKTLWAQVYLDVWKRHVSALDDASIRESALNGPDTSTRLQTFWRVGILPLTPPANIQKLIQNVQDLQKALEQLKQNPDKNKNQIATVQKELDAVLGTIASYSSQITCQSPSPDWDKLVAPSTGTLNARTQPVQTTNDACLLPPSAGYKRLENQLYRVEVHLGSDNPAGPTFKWSRENASVLTTITGINGSDITVHDLGKDAVLGFTTGQWVEIVSDDTELSGLPGQLVFINAIDEAALKITVAPAPVLAFQAGLHPKLRRWEQTGTTASANGVRVDPQSGWQELEDGIEVQFSAGNYHTGDYWLIPARTTIADIEWPQLSGSNAGPSPQPPLGIEHHYCHLALLRLNPQNNQIYVNDCREIFPRLLPPAMHVVAINWPNDDLFSPSQLTDPGLLITLDAPPEALSVNNSTMIVTAEFPLSAVVGQSANGGYDLRLSLILPGTITVNQNVIRWQLAPNQRAMVNNLSATVIGERPRAGFAARATPEPLRVRVTLKGHDIWSDQNETRYYLDGQVFGEPGTRSDQSPRISAFLPSGMAERASDFESWFFLGEPVRPSTPLRVTLVRFLAPNGDVSVATVDLTNVPPTSTTPPPQLQGVTYPDTLLANTIEITFSRAVRPESFGGDQASIILERLSPRPSKLSGKVTVVNSTMVRFGGSDVFPNLGGNVSEYRLTIVGDPSSGSVVTAQDNGAAIDGNFEAQPGGNFVLPFTITSPLIP